MHELSIAVSMLDVVAEEAERLGVEVVAIRLKLGPLSGVVKEALLSAFELARAESTMPEARLVIEEPPIIVFCPKCQAERHPVSIQEMVCSICRTPTPKVVSGREMEIFALEVRDRPEASAHPAGGAP